MSDQESHDAAVPEGMEERQALAQLRVEPFLRHGFLVNHLTSQTVNGGDVKCNSGEVGEAVRAVADRVDGGDLRPITDALLSQSMMLDANATELMNRAWRNVGEYPEAFRSYMGLALKAQAQARATLEALAKMHQPREQVVRHVHVYEGGQAVVAEQLHMHGTGVRNAGNADQSHAAGTSGAGERPALPRPDTLGNSMQGPGSARKAAVPDARRDKPRRAARKQQRP